MVLDIDVLNSSVKLVVLCKCNSSLIIPIDYRCPEARIVRVDLLEKALKPNCFLCGVRLPDILGFTS